MPQSRAGRVSMSAASGVHLSAARHRAGPRSALLRLGRAPSVWSTARHTRASPGRRTSVTSGARDARSSSAAGAWSGRSRRALAQESERAPRHPARGALARVLQDTGKPRLPSAPGGRRVGWAIALLTLGATDAYVGSYDEAKGEVGGARPERGPPGCKTTSGCSEQRHRVCDPRASWGLVGARLHESAWGLDLTLDGLERLRGGLWPSSKRPAG
jgi:hypothetical protein